MNNMKLTIEFDHKQDFHKIVSFLIIGITEELLKGRISHTTANQVCFFELLIKRSILPPKLYLAVDLGTELEAAHKLLSRDQYEKSIRDIQRLCREEIQESEYVNMQGDEHSPCYKWRCRYSISDEGSNVSG